MANLLQFNINHTTTYAYDSEINSSVMSVCMQPRNHLDQVVQDFSIQTNPTAGFSIEFDAFGNRHHFFDIHRPHAALDINVRATIVREVDEDRREHIELNQSAWKEIESWKLDWDMWEFLRFSELTPLSESLTNWLSHLDIDQKTDAYSRLNVLEKVLSDQFTYQPGSTHVDATIDNLLETKTGVCQDFAHLMIAVARYWGIPARYVSGYLYEQSEDNLRANNATHAWVECRLPGIGWLTFDPTNPKIDHRNLITVAIGRDYRDVAPSRGIAFGEAKSNLTVGVSVTKQPIESDTQLSRTQGSLQQ